MRLKQEYLYKFYESLPLSEQTLKRHKWEWQGCQLVNDLFPCEYRILKDGNEIGMVKYYHGRKLYMYEVAKP